MPKNITPETERFNFFLEARGLKQITVANVLGVTKQTVSHIATGRIGISNQVLRALEREYGLNPEWIRTGEGNMLLPKEKPHEPKLTRIPVLTSIPAGPWKFWIDSYPPGVGEDYIDWPDIKGENLFAVKVKGDSMEPRLHSGDVLIVDPDKEFVSGIAVVRYQGGYKIRAARRLNHKYRLIPLNPAYEEEEIEPDDETRLYVPVKVVCLRDV